MSVMPTYMELHPPLYGNCGWGEDTDTLDEKLLKDSYTVEQNENEGVYSSIADLMSQRQESPMEKALKELMPYEDGWDCEFASCTSLQSQDGRSGIDPCSPCWSQHVWFEETRTCLNFLLR